MGGGGRHSTGELAHKLWRQHDLDMQHFRFMPCCQVFEYREFVFIGMLVILSSGSKVASGFCMRCCRKLCRIPLMDQRASSAAKVAHRMHLPGPKQVWHQHLLMPQSGV